MKKYKKWCYWIPAVVMMVVIFLFSAADGEESSELSTGVTEQVIGIVNDVCQLEMTDAQKIEANETLEFYVRKTAHFTEYMILAFCMLLALKKCHGIYGRKLYVLAFVFTVTYAASDELHQSFVGGRSPQFRDVLIDGSGALAAVLLYLLIAGCIVTKSIDKKQGM